MPQTPVDARPELLAAVIDVAEHSLFAYSDALDRGAFEAAIVAHPADWIRARVAFRGPVGGVVEVALPASLARDLAGAFAGEAPDALDGRALVDFAGELANMMCGAWLTRGFTAHAFDLAPPDVQDGLAARAVLEPAADSDALYLALNEVPVLVRLTWLRGPAGGEGA